MNNVIVELTENQVRNLGAFLDRVTLTAKEVPAFSELIQQINKGIKDSAVEDPKSQPKAAKRANPKTR